MFDFCCILVYTTYTTYYQNQTYLPDVPTTYIPKNKIRFIYILHKPAILKNKAHTFRVTAALLSHFYMVSFRTPHIMQYLLVTLLHKFLLRQRVASNALIFCKHDKAFQFVHPSLPNITVLIIHKKVKVINSF